MQLPISFPQNFQNRTADFLFCPYNFSGNRDGWKWVGAAIDSTTQRLLALHLFLQYQNTFLS
jgi:hypothetical protein